MDIKENKTVKSHFTCSLYSLLGFCLLRGFFDFLPLTAKENRNGSKTTQKPRREDNEQVKCDLTVLFSLISIFNLLEWVTCGEQWLNILKAAASYVTSYS